VVLEKHGLLDFDTIEVDRLLDRPSAADDSVGVLVGDLPSERWQPVLELLVAAGRPVLFGEPAPALLRERIGVGRCEPLNRTGSVLPIEPGLRARALRYGIGVGGRSAPPAVRTVDRDRAVDWANLQSAPITPKQAVAWQNIALRADRWSDVTGDTVLAEWLDEDDGSRTPAMVRRGTLLGCSFGLFTAVVRGHTSEPWGHAEHRSSPRTSGLETLILGVIDGMFAEASRPRPRALPWPRGATWALTVRHDFDRPLDEAAVSRVLEAHARVGTCATWYWRSRHLRPPSRFPRVRLAVHSGNRALLAVRDATHHEIGHHTEQLWNGADAEQRLIEQVAGLPVRGTSAHGERTCFRFQGAPNVLWAERQQLSYTELIQHSHFHPHRFVAMRPNGDVELSSVICLPHHESFDVSVRASETRAERILGAAASYQLAGGLLQVMNHPDINQRPLFEMLAALPTSGRLNCTAAEAVDWWRRTHVAHELSLRVSKMNTLAISSRAGVEDLVVELLMPDGDRQLRIAHLPGGSTTTLEEADERITSES